ncbi:F-box/kelch-repeat protein At3g23880-like [Vicia villosa]|uniref:F-box/kelch-repeat protein At3g23880-like n=1 Tax=Vicia villosa TaxID=3911 RepID=UPI00273B4710|nr:F-box/kelch-repeat protein At3g23880-like [Vicia villosa]
MTAVSSSFLLSLAEETTLAKRSKTLTPPHLPFDLVPEILCRLSVKHLLQLCCVCKSWNSLISLDSNFARKQLSFSTSNKNRHQFIQSSTKSCREFLLSHSPISSFFTSASNVPVTQLRHDFKRVINNRGSGVEISTCDGILCFAINGSRAVLYNPSTRKSKKLPPLTNSKYTLVYDRITSNYKIIAVTSGYSNNQVNIHTLGTRYWRRIQGFPCSRLICTPGIFVNDTVNWFAYDPNSPKVIVSLDLEKELYRKLSLPFSRTHFETPMSLGALKGCLSILSHKKETEISRFFNVWIMKEYGNEKSWTILLSVPPTVECGPYGGYSKVLYIFENDQLLMEFYRRERRGLYIFENDQVLMEFYRREQRGLVVYDSINNTSTIPKMQNNIHDFKVTSNFYVESLISPF